MRNQIDFLCGNAEDLLQDVRGSLAHDDQAVREGDNFLHDCSLVWIRVAKHGVQGSCEGHAQVPEKLQDMRARRATKDSIFVLQANQINVAEIQEVGGL